MAIFFAFDAPVSNIYVSLYYAAPYESALRITHHIRLSGRPSVCPVPPLTH